MGIECMFVIWGDVVDLGDGGFWIDKQVAPGQEGVTLGDTFGTVCQTTLHTSRVCAYSVFAFFTAGSATAVAIVQMRGRVEELTAGGSVRAANAREH
jgi:hypothetical protein